VDKLVKEPLIKKIAVFRAMSPDDGGSKDL
jgi:hypothetical protein